jgi:hypothetical protein
MGTFTGSGIGRHLWDVTPAGTPSDAAAPLNRFEQSYHLARGKTLVRKEAPQAGQWGLAVG